MPQRYPRVSGALFDIKPTDAAGPFQLDLRTTRQPQEPRTTSISGEEWSVEGLLRAISTPSLRKEDILKELEWSLNAVADPQAELARAGVRVHALPQQAKPHYRPVAPKRNSEEEHHRHILSEIHHSARSYQEVPGGPVPELVTAPAPTLNLSVPDSGEVETWFHGLRERVMPASFISSRRSRIRYLALGAVLLTAVVGYGFTLKSRIIQEGTQALGNLESAKEQLAQLDFDAASHDFLSAYRNFSQVGEKLNFLGAGLAGAFASVPGGEKLASARNLAQIGKLIADTGQAMSEAAAGIAKTGLLFNPGGSAQVVLGEILEPMTRALERSDQNLKQIGTLLAAVDESVIPEDKRELFAEFKSRLPEFEQMAAHGVGYSKFVENLVGARGMRRYLLLFQNPSEMRPTGGFPGSYAVVTFEGGKLKDFFVDDIYNLDGQLRDLIVPPAQLQHITPTWAMRDANWFIDFPSSARTISSFFAKEAGYAVDGVITVSPRVISDILALTGPITLKQYDLTLTSENFLVTIQNEVEYGRNNKELNQPKKILVDAAPLFLSKLYSAAPTTWLEVFNVFVAGLERKDILFYFRDLNLQSFALENNFGGQVSQTDADYLMLTLSNVKGAKTDAVTDTALKVVTSMDGGVVRHKLFISRTHNGGKTPYGFYNRRNPSYVRVLVPEGAQLASITGNDKLSFAPLVDYSKGFRTDEDLAKLEQTYQTDRERGVTVFQEAGKTGFGFWMLVDPGTTKTVQVEYTVPTAYARSDYRFVLQKQPGLSLRNFQFDLALPPGISLADSAPNLRKAGNFYTFSGVLERDLEVAATLK